MEYIKKSIKIIFRSSLASNPKTINILYILVIILCFFIHFEFDLASEMNIFFELFIMVILYLKN